MTWHSILDGALRTAKPRTDGITVVLDKGLGKHAIADLCEVAGDFFDAAKIAWGSVLVTGNLPAKLNCYRSRNVIPLLGGTLFEYAYLRGSVPELLDLVAEQRLHVEISDGVIDMNQREKLRWIEQFAKVTEVYSEIGGKVVSRARDWPRSIREELEAGSTKVVIEGREIGPVGRPIRADLVESILEHVDPVDVVFEALDRPQQVFLIKRVGPNVNLGNIKPEDLLTVESFRLGLKEHTLVHMFERREKSEEVPSNNSHELRACASKV